MGKKILIISQNFYPEIGSAGNRIKNIYLLLKANCQSVKVLTTEPTYPNRKIYEDQQFWDDERINQDNEHVTRIKVTNRKYSTNIFNRLLYYLEVALKMLLFILKDKNHYDVIFVTSPPIFIGIVGLVAKYRFKAKLILDVRDLWPESLNGVGVLNHRLILVVFRFIEKVMYQKADKIIVNSKGFINSIVMSGKVSRTKITFLPNGAKEAELKFSRQPRASFNVIYAGNIGLAQDHQLLIELAKKLESYPISFIVIGYGIHKVIFEKKIKAHKLKNVSFMKPQTRKQCLKLIAEHDIGLVTLTNKDVFDTVLPGKLIDYMTCGVPIVAAVSGNAKQVIEQAKVGFASEKRDVDEMVQSILHLYNTPHKREQLSLNGKKYVKQHFLWENNLGTLLSLLDKEKVEAEYRKKVEVL